jgi:hypothetical protein
MRIVIGRGNRRYVVELNPQSATSLVLNSLLIDRRIAELLTVKQS